jgi:tetratricopeptide (TPR) repeat protein
MRLFLPILTAAFLIGALSGGAEAAKLGFSRSYCLSDTLSPIEAISSCTAVLQKFHRNVSVLIRRGAAFAELGEFDYAVGDFSRAINIDQSSVLALQLRGLVLEMQGLYQDSLVNYMRGLELSPSSQEIQEAILRVTDAIVAESAAQQLAGSPDEGKSRDDSGSPASLLQKPETPDSAGGQERLILIASSVLVLGSLTVSFLLTRQRT